MVICKLQRIDGKIYLESYKTAISVHHYSLNPFNNTNNISLNWKVIIESAFCF